ncbi:histone H1-like repetitive region-containing protein [Candidatus Poriferisodalis sp.]|uniref:TraR/DksA family transcriptional regulator n=1 Tax=Candidatus Poriferisodalis sp. TaxID=3101277 RepID=UPI003C6FE3B5
MATAKKAAARKTAAKKAPAPKNAANPSGANAAAKKTDARKTDARKTDARKTGAREADARKTDARKTGAREADARKTDARKTGAASKTAAKKTAPRRKPAKPRFGAVFLEKQHQALLAERRRYTAHAERYEAEAEQLVNEREPGDVQFDEESGEGDSIAVERDRALQISAREREEIAEIDAALARIEDGTYGICIVSGKPIPKERLEAIPHASMRVEVKSSGPAWRRP